MPKHSLLLGVSLALIAFLLYGPQLGAQAPWGGGQTQYDHEKAQGNEAAAEWHGEGSTGLPADHEATENETFMESCGQPCPFCEGPLILSAAEEMLEDGIWVTEAQFEGGMEWLRNDPESPWVEHCP